jgi:hypothetical protein
MKHDLSVYVVETLEDAIELGYEDIYDFTIDGDECSNCGMVIGVLSELDQILPCVIITGVNDIGWPICIDCASPLLYPAEWAAEI